MSATLFDTPSRAASTAAERSAGARWFGRVSTTLVLLFLVFDFAAKLVSAQFAVDGSAQLGYQAHQVPIIGALALCCTILYAIPRTAVLGAILLTGYLGGAVASNIRVDAPLFSHTLFPVYFAALVWAGLYVRDARVRAIIGPRPSARRPGE